MIEILLATVLAIIFIMSPFLLSYLALNWLASYSNPGRHRKSSAHPEWRNVQCL